MNKCFFLLILASGLLRAQTPAELLAKSIAYHDPQNPWPTLEATFTYTETRPEGPDRSATFQLDNKNRVWTLDRNGDEVYEIKHDQAMVLAGEKEASRGLMLRNYYLYLWGLPMKLKDESTPEITRVEDAEVNGKKAHQLRVAYQKETYYFSFDPISGRMIEYRFYKDEAAGKGELITLEDEITFNGLKIPQKRSWYTLPDMKYLGTDILDKIE